MAAALYDALRSMLRRGGSVRFGAMRWRRGGGAALSGALRRASTGPSTFKFRFDLNCRLQQMAALRTT